MLFLTPQLPYPPHQGATQRNFNLMAGLAARHTLDLFSLLAPGDDPAGGPLCSLVRQLVTAPQPRRTAWRRLRDTLLSPLPDMALRLWNPDAFARLHQHVRDHPPQLIQIEGIEMAPYIYALRQAGVTLPPVIYDAHNAESLLQRRAFQSDLKQPRRWPTAAYSAIQTAKLGRYEHRLIEAVDAVVAVSEADAQVLARLAPGIRPAVAPNGVDLAFYAPALHTPNPYQRSGPHLVFTGKMDFRPNIDAVLWFAERVLPALADCLADCLPDCLPDCRPHFWIVGRDPHPRLDALRSHTFVTITGSVDDIRPYIAHADLVVVPLLAGGGTRLKLLEAMAMARPIVSTRLGADGYPVVDGEQLALADSPADFVAACRRLLCDRPAAEALGRRGRSFVEQNFGWEQIVPRLEAVYGSLRDELGGFSA